MTKENISHYTAGPLLRGLALAIPLGLLLWALCLGSLWLVIHG